MDDDFASAFELYTKLVDSAPTRASAWIHRSATLLKLDAPRGGARGRGAGGRPRPGQRQGAPPPRHGAPRPRPPRGRSDGVRARTRARPHVAAAALVDRQVRRRTRRARRALLLRVRRLLRPRAPWPAAPAYKHQWYQSQTHVTIEVLAKGVDPEAVRVRPPTRRDPSDGARVLRVVVALRPASVRALASSLRRRRARAQRVQGDAREARDAAREGRGDPVDGSDARGAGGGGVKTRDRRSRRGLSDPRARSFGAPRAYPTLAPRPRGRGRRRIGTRSRRS